MTAPHRYIKNQLVRISRGTQNGLPLIVADEEEKLWHEIHYIFAREATRFEIVLMALSVTPFGYDAVIFDPEMQRSHFLKSVNQCISCAIKRRIDHRDSLWSNAKPGNIPILDIESLKKAIIEVCLVPVKAGYVRTIKEWVLPAIGPSNWDETLSFDDPNQDPKEPERRSFDHYPGRLPLVSYATKVLDLAAEMISEIQRFEHAESRRRKKVLFPSDLYKTKTFEIHANQDVGVSICFDYALCVSSARRDKIAKTMKAFYLNYVQAFATFRWPIWPSFPCGTLKMREYYNVSCDVMEDDPFVFDPS